MNNVQFYTNRQEYQGQCPQIPTRQTNFLDKNNCLSEFMTSTDKELARANLGIPDIINFLNQKIDAKVIERGSIAWDFAPTEGNTDKVLSSNTVYNTLLKYALRSELDNSIQQVWSDTVNKISENYNKIEIEINKLNESLRNYIDEVRCSFDDYTTYINQQFSSFKEQVLQQYDQMQSDIENLRTFVNDTVDTLTSNINNQLQQFGENIDNTIQAIRQEMEQLSSSVDQKNLDTLNQVNQKNLDTLNQVNQKNLQLQRYVDQKIQESNQNNVQLQRYVDQKVQEIDQNNVQLQRHVDQKVQEVDQKNLQLKQYVDQKVEECSQQNDNILLHFAELKKFVKDEYLNLYNSIYSNLNEDKIIPLEQRIDQLQLTVDSFLKTSGGTALTNQFGDAEYIGVNQKTLTKAINKIWEKIESMTGEMSSGINMTVSPTYFISEEGCTVNISASSSKTNGNFEHIAFYANGDLIEEAENVETFNTQTTIYDTTEIKCIAKIMGIEYEKSKTVTRYNSFFLFTGSFESDIDMINYASSHPEYSKPVTPGLRGAYDITCNQGDNIIIILGKSFARNFIRADLNSIEIPFIRKEVAVNGEEYTIFVSTNTYNAGTYNIDING